MRRSFPYSRCFLSWSLREMRCDRGNANNISRFEFTSPWWKQDYSPDACAFHRNILNWSNQKIGTIVRSIDISVWYDYWYFHRSQIWNVCVFAKLLEAIWHDIPSSIQPIEILDDQYRWYRKRKEFKKCVFLARWIKSGSDIGRSRETVMKMSVSNDAARLSQRSWRFFPAFRGKSFERDDMQCDSR